MKTLNILTSRNVKLLASLFVGSLMSFNAFASTNEVAIDENIAAVNNFNPDRQYTIRNVGNDQLASTAFNSRFIFSSLVYANNPVIGEGQGFQVRTAPTRPQRILDFQKWRFVNLGNNIVQIINIRSGRAVDVANANATPTQQSINAIDRGQQWRVSRVGRGVSFRNVLTNRVLSASGNDLVQANASRFNRNQQWNVSITESSAPAELDAVVLNLSFSPNPANNVLNVVVDSPVNDANAFIQIRQRGFQNIRNFPINLRRGRNELTIDVSYLPVEFHTIALNTQGAVRKAFTFAVAR
ncbi:RICIN domain-containing protein [Aquimarina agarilytica]|uniref:RICIN domain-containing protein n=1 Tax=Aquimarina agarilytica TaxID=1087449 RepID=UPI0002885F63|nr:RICIN domain-containing protein [Aquimarina agarilytica]